VKRVSVLLAVTLLFAGSLASAQAPCSLSTLRGAYAFELKGQAFQGGISPVPGPGGLPMLQGAVLPIYFSGLLAVAADGTATGAYWGLFGLVPLGVDEPHPWNATFTVNPDCTGEMTYPNLLGSINVEKIVVLDNGREIRTVAVETPGMPWETTSVRISRAGGSGPMCGPDSFRGTYVMRCHGIEVMSPGPPPAYGNVTPLFRLEVGPGGTMTGRHFGRDLPLEGHEVTGQATVNPDCSLQATMQTGAVPGGTILTKGVLYDNGREMFGGPIAVTFGATPASGVFVGFGCHATRTSK
jgi:hypothetical protein